MTTASTWNWRRDREGLGTWEHRGQVAVAGVGHSPADRRWDGKSMDQTLGAYTIRAVQAALDDAGLTVDDLDGIIICSEALGDPWAPRPYFEPPYDTEDGLTYVTAEWLIQQMGIKAEKLTYVNSKAPAIGGMMGLAAQAVGDGLCSTTLVIYPTGNLEGRYHHNAPENLSEEARGARQWLAPWGNQGGAMMHTAAVFQEYNHHYGVGGDWLAPFCVNQRRNGLRTWWSYYTRHEPYQPTEEDYLNSRWVQKPLRLFDCDRPVQASAAYIFTTAAKARDMKQKPVYILNHAQNGNPPRSTMPTLAETEEWVSSLARKMWEGSGLKSTELDVFNPYDGYLAFSQHYLEGFQWHGVKFGESADFFKEDITTEGPHPFCSGGGNNGNGRTRTAMFTDCIEQLRGTAGERQIRLRAETAATGGMTPGGCGWLMFSVVPD